MSILFGTNLENAKAFLKVRFSSVQAITNLRLVANFSVFFFFVFWGLSRFHFRFHFPPFYEFEARKIGFKRNRSPFPREIEKTRNRDGVYVQLFNAILQ